MNLSETDPTFEVDEAGVVRAAASLKSRVPGHRRRIRGLNCCSDLMEYRIVLSATFAAAFSMDAALGGGHDSTASSLRSEDHGTTVHVRTAQIQSDLISKGAAAEDFIGPQSAVENRGDFNGFENDAASVAQSGGNAVGPIARHEVFGPRALMRLLSLHEDASVSGPIMKADAVVSESEMLPVKNPRSNSPDTAAFRGTTSGFRVPGSADAIGILKSLALRNGREDTSDHPHQKPALATQREFAGTNRSGRVATIAVPDAKSDSQKKADSESKPSASESSVAVTNVAEPDVIETDESLVGGVLASPDNASRKPGVIRDRFASPRIVKHQNKVTHQNTVKHQDTVNYQEKVTQVRHEQPDSEGRGVHETSEHTFPGTKFSRSDIVEIEIRPGRQKSAIRDAADDSMIPRKDRARQREVALRSTDSENSISSDELPASPEASLPQIRPQQAE